MVEHGKMIKKIRREKGYTQIELARKAGIGLNTLRRYENDERQPNLDKLNRIAEALEVSMEFLLEDYSASNLPTWTDTMLDKDFSIAEDAKIHPERYTAERDPETGRIIAYRINNRIELLQSLFHKLNENGQEKALDYVTDLSEQEKYTKPDEE